MPSTLSNNSPHKSILKSGLSLCALLCAFTLPLAIWNIEPRELPFVSNSVSSGVLIDAVFMLGVGIGVGLLLLSILLSIQAIRRAMIAPLRFRLIASIAFALALGGAILQAAMGYVFLSIP